MIVSGSRINLEGQNELSLIGDSGFKALKCLKEIGCVISAAEKRNVKDKLQRKPIDSGFMIFP